MSDSALYLCLDQGGHASRAAVFDAQGELVCLAKHAIATRRDGVQVEHAPEELVATLQRAATDALSELGERAADVVAAGLATQRSSIVCWHADDDRPLSPVLSWQDRRAADWLAGFAEHESRIHELTGLVLSPHYGVSKLRWCMEHLDAVAAAHSAGQLRFGPLASWLAGQLGGMSPVADPANASRTLLWDRRQLDWSAELLELFGVPHECLPPTAATQSDFGHLKLAGQEIPLTLVTGDQSAALFAFGKPSTQQLYGNLGTGSFLQKPLDDPFTESGRLLASVVRADKSGVTGVLEATVNGAGAAINAQAAELGIPMERVKAESAGWLEQLPADAPLFLNTVAGLGSPWWLADIEPRFDGGSSASPEVKLAAVMESIAFLLAINVECIVAAGGRADSILMTGGLAQVTPLLQSVADLTGMAIERARVVEATARGVACQLAGMPDEWPAAETEVRLEPASNSQLSERYSRWRALMPRW